MAYYLGSFVGGFLAATLIGLLVGLVLKTKPPTERALIAAFIAWIICGIIAGFGMADGGPFRFGAILVYAPGAVAAFFYLQWHYGKMWRDDYEDV
jgi:hypothetical protein